MKILEYIKLKTLERKLANAYRECCSGLLEEHMQNTSMFVPIILSFHSPKMDVYEYSRRLRDGGYNPRDVLLKAARGMDSEGKQILLFYGIFDVNDLDFKSRQERIPRVEDDR